MALFPLKKVKLVLGDFHLGKGRTLPDGSRNLLEDFTSDHQYVEFLEYHMSGPYKRAEVELVLNGDFFNLLQVDYRDKFTDFITEGDSLHKLRKIFHGHPAMFDQMARFSQEPHHSIRFILGNHDPGLLWEGVREALRERLGGEVNFEMEVYRFDGVHIEHGNQYVPDNRYDPSQYFLTENLPEPIINLPFGSFFIIHYLNQVKKERPYMDRVYPFRLYARWALIHDFFFAIKSIFRVVVWFFGFILKPNPARKLGVRQAFSILRAMRLHPRLHKEAKRILLSQKNMRIVIFGHTHQHIYMSYGPDKEYFNSGTWCEKISLEVGSLGRQLRLTFVIIDYDKKGIPRASLKEWRGHAEVIEDVAL